MTNSGKKSQPSNQAILNETLFPNKNKKLISPFALFLIMPKKLLLVPMLFVFFLALAGFVAGSAPILSVEDCLGGRNFDEDNLFQCLSVARPMTIESCNKIPAQYSAELKDKCLLRGNYCDAISSAEIKQQCLNRLAALKEEETKKSIWNAGCLLIPIIVFGIIVFGFFEFFKKKLTKKKALVLLAAIVLLSIIGFILVITAPCNTCWTMCFY